MLILNWDFELLDKALCDFTIKVNNEHANVECKAIQRQNIISNATILSVQRPFLDNLDVPTLSIFAKIL